MSLEDELIQKRQEHEMMMEMKKLELEKERLELEKRKEARLEEEGRRRDQIATSQIEMQSQMFMMMNRILDK
ncbi:MAG TPA: hypothetical protein VL088_09060 [Pedobacter sp.]|nr:hypothetical protein [Pedobacter sp.]